MKKIMLLVCILLCMSVCAYAAETINVSGTGVKTLVLEGVTIDGGASPALCIENTISQLTIILKDNTVNTLKSDGRGIVNNGADLVITCERAGDGHECDENCGVLDTTGIGGYGDFSGTLTVNGGKVSAIRDSWSPGIGSGEFTGRVVINGGEVVASGYAAGIGGEDGCGFSGSVIVNGGKLTAVSYGASAGIGGGDVGEFSGTVTINGGEVTAVGGGDAAGIGGGNGSDVFSGTVIINGGKVKVSSEGGAGIGTGDGNDGAAIFAGRIIIRGGDLIAYSERGAALGAGYEGVVADGAIIEIDPASEPIYLKAGDDEAGAVFVEGSPFTSKTDLIPLVGEEHYVRTAIPVPPSPSTSPDPVPPPESPVVPETGDSTDFVLLAALAVIGMVVITVILRRKNEA